MSQGKSVFQGFFFLYITVAVGWIVRQDDVAMNVISRHLAQAILRENSSFIPISGNDSSPDIQFDDYNKAMKELVFVSGMEFASLTSLFWAEVATHYQNDQAFDLRWVEKRLDLSRLFQNTVSVLQDCLATDPHHYVCDKSIPVSFVSCQTWQIERDRQTDGRMDRQTNGR